MLFLYIYGLNLGRYIYFRKRRYRADGPIVVGISARLP